GASPFSGYGTSNHAVGVEGEDLCAPGYDDRADGEPREESTAAHRRQVIELRRARPRHQPRRSPAYGKIARARRWRPVRARFSAREHEVGTDSDRDDPNPERECREVRAAPRRIALVGCPGSVAHSALTLGVVLLRNGPEAEDRAGADAD